MTPVLSVLWCMGKASTDVNRLTMMLKHALLNNKKCGPPPSKFSPKG